mgnify:CR=1 FL=1
MPPTAFDYVVDQLEASIRAAFSVEQTPVPDTAHQVTRESLLRTQCGIVFCIEGVSNEPPQVQWV